MAPPPWTTEEQRMFLSVRIATFHELTTTSRGRKNFKRIDFLAQVYQDFEKQFTKEKLDSMLLPKLQLGGTDSQRVQAWISVSLSLINK
jgi:hypothetical protein